MGQCYDHFDGLTIMRANGKDRQAHERTCPIFRGPGLLLMPPMAFQLLHVCLCGGAGAQGANLLAQGINIINSQALVV